MVVAMIAVGMVQVTLHEVIDVIAVGHRLVAAAWAVTVSLGMPSARMVGRAGVRVHPADGQNMLGDLPALLVLQTAVMQVIHVAIMPHGGVAAVRSVLVLLFRGNGFGSFHLAPLLARETEDRLGSYSLGRGFIVRNRPTPALSAEADRCQQQSIARRVQSQAKQDAQ